MIYFTADTHFGHSNIIKYCNRPFETIKEMDEILIENINKTVRSNDILWHLGDFCFKYQFKIEEYAERLNCKNIHIILGNHDKQLKKYSCSLLNHGIFKSIQNFFEGKINEQSMTLCHYAMRIWNKSHYGAWQLYGHSHGTLEDNPNALSIDVGIDTEWIGQNFRHQRFLPYSFDEIVHIMSLKEWKSIDHHTGKDI